MNIKATFTPTGKPTLVNPIEAHPTMMRPRVGRVWYNLLIGCGCSAFRGILPEALNTGYDKTIDRHAKIAELFGAEGMLIRNPGGTDGSMDFDQWLKAWPDGRERAKRTAQFRRGMYAAMDILGFFPAVYLGSLKTDPYWATLAASTFWEELGEMLSQSIAFIPAAAPIVIDGAGSDIQVSDKVRYCPCLNNRGPVWCEPWPKQSGPWYESRGFTQSDYLRKLLNRSIPYAAEIATGPAVFARQVVMVEETPEPPIAEVISWMRLGLTVAVKPDENGLYQGMTAAQMEREANK